MKQSDSIAYDNTELLELVVALNYNRKTLRISNNIKKNQTSSEMDNQLSYQLTLTFFWFVSEKEDETLVKELYFYSTVICCHFLSSRKSVCFYIPFLPFRAI